MTRNKILNGTAITAFTVILLALAPSTAQAGNDVHPGVFDVKPGSCPNPINLGSNGVVPVAILGSDTLDVNDIVLSETQETWRPKIEDVGTPFVADQFQSIFDCSEEGPDGVLDLTLKIPANSFLILCDVPDQHGAIIGIVVSITDGPTFPVWDVVKVLAKNNNNCPPLPP